MLDNETNRKLRLLNIGEFIDAIELQDRDPEVLEMSFDERFKLLTDRVFQEKYNAKVMRLLKSAKCRFPKADVTDIYYHKDRPFSKTLITELATCKFVDQSQSVIILGYASTGKTYLGCALAREACRHQFRTRYIRTSELLSEFDDASVISGGTEKLLRKYSNFKVLILDEWLTKDISKAELEFLFELSERRYDNTSTIFCTLYPPEEWVRRLGKGTQAESIYERFRFNNIQVKTGEMNMREIYNKK